jgi:4'-phosphopantetheinyl transferase
VHEGALIYLTTLHCNYINPGTNPLTSNLKKGKVRLSWCPLMNKNNSLDFLDFQSIGIGQNKRYEKSDVYTPLDNDTIHLWSAHYNDLALHLPFARDFLSPGEQEKSSEFVKPADAKRYILRHGMLRYILSTYTNTEPESLPLVKGIRGKPGLDPHSDFHDLSFSLSHADQVVSVGIVRNHSIGIDIVKTDPGYPFNEIIEYLFTPMEKECMERIAPERRYLMFFKIWALKEAIVKSTADGIRLMDSTDVSSVIEGSRSGCFRILKINEKSRDFIICQFSPAKSYQGAVAVCLGP